MNEHISQFGTIVQLFSNQPSSPPILPAECSPINEWYQSSQSQNIAYEEMHAEFDSFRMGNPKNAFADAPRTTLKEHFLRLYKILQ